MLSAMLLAPERRVSFVPPCGGNRQSAGTARSVLRCCGAGEAEAVVPVAAAGIVPVAVGGTAVPRVVVPAAAAQDTVVARSSSQTAKTFLLHALAPAISVNAVSAVARA